MSTSASRRGPGRLGHADLREAKAALEPPLKKVGVGHVGCGAVGAAARAAHRRWRSDRAFGALTMRHPEVGARCLDEVERDVVELIGADDRLIAELGVQRMSAARMDAIRLVARTMRPKVGETATEGEARAVGHARDIAACFRVGGRSPVRARPAHAGARAVVEADGARWEVGAVQVPCRRRFCPTCEKFTAERESIALDAAYRARIVELRQEGVEEPEHLFGFATLTVRDAVWTPDDDSQVAMPDDNGRCWMTAAESIGRFAGHLDDLRKGGARGRLYARYVAGHVLQVEHAVDLAGTQRGTNADGSPHIVGYDRVHTHAHAIVEYQPPPDAWRADDPSRMPAWRDALTQQLYPMLWTGAMESHPVPTGLACECAGSARRSCRRCRASGTVVRYDYRRCLVPRGYGHVDGKCETCTGVGRVRRVGEPANRRYRCGVCAGKGKLRYLRPALPDFELPDTPPTDWGRFELERSRRWARWCVQVHGHVERPRDFHGECDWSDWLATRRTDRAIRDRLPPIAAADLWVPRCQKGEGPIPADFRADAPLRERRNGWRSFCAEVLALHYGVTGEPGDDIDGRQPVAVPGAQKVKRITQLRLGQASGYVLKPPSRKGVPPKDRDRLDQMLVATMHASLDSRTRQFGTMRSWRRGVTVVASEDDGEATDGAPADSGGASPEPEVIDEADAPQLALATMLWVKEFDQVSARPRLVPLTLGRLRDACGAIEGGDRARLATPFVRVTAYDPKSWSLPGAVGQHGWEPAIVDELDPRDLRAALRLDPRPFAMRDENQLITGGLSLSDVEKDGLDRDQIAAVEKIEEWCRAPHEVPQWFCMQGLAGTGKSLLIARIVETAERSARFKIRVTATTAKAASELNRRLPSEVEVTTLHSLLRRFAGRRMDADLLIVDEASMLDVHVRRRAEKMCARILAVGDPGQLGAIGEPAGIIVEAEDDANRHTLGVVHRQSEDSEILDYAAHLRAGHSPRSYTPTSAAVEIHDELDLGGANWPLLEELFPVGAPPRGVIIVATNATRVAINTALRRRYGHADLDPQPGERVVAKRNDYRIGVRNGETYTVIRSEAGPAGTVILELRADDDSVIRVHALREQFGSEAKVDAKRGVALIDFAYAMTAHSMQGSAAPTVIVVDDLPGWVSDAAKWRYTAATRAERRVVWCRRIAIGDVASVTRGAPDFEPWSVAAWRWLEDLSAEESQRWVDAAVSEWELAS